MRVAQHQTFFFGTRAFANKINAAHPYPPRERRFTKEDNIKTSGVVKSSEQRSIRTLILQQYPALEPYVDDFLPKKELSVCKWCAAAQPDRHPPSGCNAVSHLAGVLAVTHMCVGSKDYIQMIVDPAGELIFFQCRNGPFIPTLRFLHRCTPLPPGRHASVLCIHI